MSPLRVVPVCGVIGLTFDAKLIVL